MSWWACIMATGLLVSANVSCWQLYQGRENPLSCMRAVLAAVKHMQQQCGALSPGSF